MAESRGGKEDKRLKLSFDNLWVKGTDYVTPERFQEVFSSRRLKVKAKSNNVTGLQLADLIAHPSRNEILMQHGYLERKLAPFAKSVIEILRHKYDRVGSRVYGRKMIHKKGP